MDYKKFIMMCQEKLNPVLIIPAHAYHAFPDPGVLKLFRRFPAG
jgi:hypothetical protein